MIFARLLNGRLSDIANREQTFAEDVPLDAMPAGVGPFSYDAPSRLAVRLDDASLSLDEQAAKRSPPARVLMALILRASSGFSGYTAARRARIQAVIDNAATGVEDLLQ